MLPRTLIVLAVAWVATSAALAASAPISGPPPTVTLTLCPATLLLAPGTIGNLTGEAYNPGNVSLPIGLNASWASTGTNVTASWRVTPEPAQFTLGPRAFHAVTLRVRASPTPGASNDTLLVAPVGGILVDGWAPLRIPVAEERASTGANSSACVRTTFQVPFPAPPAPKLAAGTDVTNASIPWVALGWAAGAVGTAGLAGLAAWAARSEDRWLRVVGLFAPLFTRLAPSRLLEQEVRDRLYQTIQDAPGIHFVSVRDRLSLSTGVATHHLRILERNRLVTSRREGRYRAYYPLTTRLPPPPALPLNATAKRLLEILEAEGRVEFSSLPARLDVTKSTVSYNVKLLSDRGLVKLERDASGRWIVSDLRVPTVRTSS